jgi:hypothetical protein
MPAILGPIAGNECNLYYNTTLAATFTVSGAVLVADAIDVNLSGTFSTASVKSRASIYESVVPGTNKLELTFGYQYRSDAGGDTTFTALRQAWIAKTVWHWAVMDNVIASPGVKGSNGQTFPGLITEFTVGQELESAVIYNIKVEPYRAYNSGTLIDPAWLVIAATY